MTFSKRAVLLAIFVLSGAAALIDEIVWSRQLVLVFGNTTQAVSAILMGATLPTLTRQFAGDVSLAGAFSRLYAANTIGAIVGTVVAGFVLIELLGLSGALAVGASCSAVAGLSALWLGRGVQGAGAS